MDTNYSLNYWLKRHPTHKLTLQYDEMMGGRFVAVVHGPECPSFVGYGYDAAAAICDLNVQVAGHREGEAT